MATVETMPAVQHSVLHGVAWHTYRELRESPDNEHVRMTYDRGVLEIMSPSIFHERVAEVLGLLIAAWMDELDLDSVSCGTLTCKREDLEKGFEPDKCYYVQHEPVMWDKTDLDLAVDPPPDLAVEIDMTRSSVNKMEIYAAFGVPELWQFNGRKLRVSTLEADGQYRQRMSSICLPRFPLAEVETILQEVGKVRDRRLVRRFRDWVRKTFSAGDDQG